MTWAKELEELRAREALAEQMGVPVDDMRAQLALLRPQEPIARVAAGGAR